MRTSYQVIPVIGGLQHKEVDWPREPGFDTIKRLVEPFIKGQHMEHVSVLLENGQSGDMFVSEEGGLWTPNERATVHYRRAWLTRHPGADPDSLAMVWGPAILFARRVWF